MKRAVQMKNQKLELPSTTGLPFFVRGEQRKGKTTINFGAKWHQI